MHATASFQKMKKGKPNFDLPFSFWWFTDLPPINKQPEKVAILS